MSRNHLVPGWGCAWHLYLARLSDPALFIVLQFPVLEGLFPGIRHRCHWLPAVVTPQSTCLLYPCTFFFLNIYIFVYVCLGMRVLCVWSEDKWPQAWFCLLNHPSGGLQCFVYIVYILGERVKTGLSPGLI